MLRFGFTANPAFSSFLIAFDVVIVSFLVGVGVASCNCQTIARFRVSGKRKVAKNEKSYFFF